MMADVDPLANVMRWLGATRRRAFVAAALSARNRADRDEDFVLGEFWNVVAVSADQVERAEQHTLNRLDPEVVAYREAHFLPDDDDGDTDGQADTDPRRDNDTE